ncbi:fibronectin type III domain-containing protein [Leucobacter sp. cx-42]|uniref:fibronectin type III domain-containing protein n=1 Tax=unclassified Leucobacter TaxID=2621730 RepID=UPI00165E419A|nr:MULTISPECIES: fibronectin type III domain-containing protein [unclassified Leucobacter]MBC9954951.1 fibronectin type III domain-containing protein [Leucobacter sp. cx-42]
MAVFNKTLSSGYTLRLTVVVQSQNATARTTTYSYSLQLIKNSGSGKWASGTGYWSVRSPSGTVVSNGSISGYDFRNYSTLTLKSGTVSFSGDAARTWWGVFDDIVGYGELGGGTVDGVLTPPKLPSIAPPAAPSTPSVTRNSDTQHSLSWTRNGAYTSVQVWRGTSTSNMTQIGTASGNAFSYVDKTTKTNQRYYYKVRGVNANGTSGFSGTSGAVYTTPAAPSGVSAVRSGTSIAVAASTLPPYATSYDIEDNGAVIASSVQLPWTHTAPSNTVSHRYRVRAKRGSLVSGWSAYSATVYVPAPPGAPTNLAPNGGLVGEGTTQFSWRHNSLDTSPQATAELRYRLDGGGWITVPIAGGAESTPVDVTPGVLEWQVRTKGGHASFGDWSAVAAAQVIEPPQVTVAVPGEVHERPTLTVVWETVQADSLVQSSWIVELRSGEDVLETRSGTGSGTQVMLRTRLPDGAMFQVAVQAAVGPVVSEWSVQEFLVEFVPPAPPMVMLGWDDSLGTGSISVEPGSSEDVVEPTVSMQVERSFDGETWELVVEGLEPVTQVTDAECLSFGETMYRVTAFTQFGASADVTEVLMAESWAVWLGGGEGYMLTARLPYDPEVSVSVARARTKHRFEGRPLAVAYSSPYVDRSVAHSGRLLDDDQDVATRRALQDLALVEEPVHLYRDPTGERMYGVLTGELVVDREFDGIWTYSFAVEETERA